MTVTFPSNPTVGQIYNSPPQSWVWNGTAWAGGTQATLPSYVGQNKLVNPFMEIDQAHEGVNQTLGGATYIGDGWIAALSSANAGVGSGLSKVAGGAPGQPFHLSVTTVTGATAIGAADYYQVSQSLEAEELADTQFGTSNAQPLTISFWAFCTIAGTYYVALRNGPSPSTRSYLAPFTISSASVWQFISVTIPGDTAGTWTLSGNGAGMLITWVLGAGTTYQAPSPNTWVTGNFFGLTGQSNAMLTTVNASFALGPAKLELGLAATPLQRTSFQAELARCQRYYEKSHNPGTAPGTSVGSSGQYNSIYMNASSTGNSNLSLSWPYKVTKRALPTITMYAFNGSAGNVSSYVSAWAASAGGISSNTQTSVAIGCTLSGIQAMGADFVADARL
jgi:hypothetical protein